MVDIASSVPSTIVKPPTGNSEFVPLLIIWLEFETSVRPLYILKVYKILNLNIFQILNTPNSYISSESYSSSSILKHPRLFKNCNFLNAPFILA